MGLDPSRVTEIVKGERRVKLTEIKPMAEYLDLPEVDITSRLTGAEMPMANEAIPAPFAPPIPSNAEMPRDVPVMGTAQGGDADGDFEMNGQIVDYVRRPPRLAGRRDVFCIYLQGESMIPWREPSQMVYVETLRQPRPSDYVVIELRATQDGGARPALVKRLLAVTPTKVRLLQYNPRKEIEIDRRRILNMRRVIDWDELMGV